MPTYLYQCEIHGEFEQYHSITEQLQECPQCKEQGKPSAKVVRLIAPGGNFILNGSGWAKDNYS